MGGDGEILLRRRPESGLLGGMQDLTNDFDGFSVQSEGRQALPRAHNSTFYEPVQAPVYRHRGRQERYLQAKRSVGNRLSMPDSRSKLKFSDAAPTRHEGSWSSWPP